MCSLGQSRSHTTPSADTAWRSPIWQTDLYQAHTNHPYNDVLLMDYLYHTTTCGLSRLFLVGISKSTTVGRQSSRQSKVNWIHPIEQNFKCVVQHSIAWWYDALLWTPWSHIGMQACATYFILRWFVLLRCRRVAPNSNQSVTEITWKQHYISPWIVTKFGKVMNKISACHFSMYLYTQ